MQCDAETRGCCAVSMWDITRDQVPRSLSRKRGLKRRTRIARMLEHERWDRVFSATCMGVPSQLRPDQRNLAGLVVPEAEADQGVAPVIVIPAVPKTDQRRCVTKRERDLVKYGYTDECQARTMRRFLKTTDAEIALASSWQRKMTRDTLSECLGLFIQRLESRVREPEKRWKLVNRRLWKINNQPVPTVRVGVSSSSGTRAGSGSRANEANTDDSETKRVGFTERAEARRGRHAHETIARSQDSRVVRARWSKMVALKHLQG